MNSFIIGCLRYLCQPTFTIGKDNYDDDDVGQKHTYIATFKSKYLLLLNTGVGVVD